MFMRIVKMALPFICLASCSTKAGTGALVGAGVGAVAGGVIGGGAGGALIGAGALFGLTGLALYYYFQQEKAKVAN